jgi:hypothetical protein
MKKLSVWAKNHKKTSRLIIVFSFMLLTLLGVTAGTLLLELKVILPTSILSLFVLIYVTGFFIYPARSLKGTKLTAAAFYIRQKAGDILLAGSTFLLIIFLSNRPGTFFQSVNLLNATNASLPVLPKDSTAGGFKPIKAFAASMKDENGKKLKWKERKKLLKEQVRSIRKSSNLSQGGKAALIVLSILIALGLLALVGGLACNLSCSGSEGAALIVGIGGGALVIFLLVVTIRSIQRGKKPDPRKEPE